ncbi:hypothetical protein [Novosphingobium resinovorum]|uniref:hypothetical protein n=1 Tax=Novosphingobium resinovorum TaxID=158500 RepID=UPI003D2C9550
MIHPRRLKGSASNIARYYAIGDYYSKGAGEHSEWGGAIAADLHLEGKVDRGSCATCSRAVLPASSSDGFWQTDRVSTTPAGTSP